MSDREFFDGGCPACGSEEYEARVVNEVDGMAVGPYTEFECDSCGYEWVSHD